MHSVQVGFLAGGRDNMKTKLALRPDFSVEPPSRGIDDFCRLEHSSTVTQRQRQGADSERAGEEQQQPQQQQSQEQQQEEEEEENQREQSRINS